MSAEKDIIAEGSSGPSNPLRVGVENAVSNILKAVESACDQAGLSRGDIVAATLGLAGVRRQDLRERVKDSFADKLRLRYITVVTDADIALYGTTLGGIGLTVIAGTGSVCIGINASGKTALAGGWGPVAGDEGGGRGIAGEALHAVAKASDGRAPATMLTDRAAEYFRASNVDNLIGAIYSPQMDNSRIAGFARLVVETAQLGDIIAMKIITDAGRELGIAAAAVIKRLGLENEEFPIGCVGSVFNAGELLTDPMKEMIAAVAPKAHLTTPAMPPAHAAALMSFTNS